MVVKYVDKSLFAKLLLPYLARGQCDTVYHFLNVIEEKTFCICRFSKKFFDL